MTQDLAGKVVLITGATDGIGKAAATEFAKRGATLTIVGRNKQKTEQVLTELKALSGNQNIDFLLCDLSRMADVKRAAEEFKARHDRLDILVNNAGATFKKPTMGPDGVELTFALNHLGYFQLTTALLDLLRNTLGARVVSTSSGMQARGKLDLEKTPTSLEGSGPGAYAASKLANILFTKELQRRLDGTTAIANCFEPGTVRTQFGGFWVRPGLLAEPRVHARQALREHARTRGRLPCLACYLVGCDGPQGRVRLEAALCTPAKAGVRPEARRRPVDVEREALREGVVGRERPSVR